ncbi:folate-binding protein [Aliiroseovarius subalbicans]|uniref:CAF17-like 4Fe-4S cluster assembly/insertion protein YgfZ n=1 Tax=Aliiroseovarius subalbicans TaxID=2925840 RepID=UPI001F5AE62A|nr:folate-binding protein [Aliiroseovarius subalbicans]MCI2399053.1 folate-binding protein [Aliiroseovarius subalbicans]
MTRKILTLIGADREHFLQGLVTNDVTRDGLSYAALLTPQGKYLADFFLVPQDDAILIDVDAALAPGLAQRLGMYKLRADVQITPSDITVTRGTGPAPDGAFADPRHPALGWRGYGVGQDDATDWDAIRVAHVIPETGVELTGESYILEAGFERLNGVDFRKGCYVGQEVTARMKHKTELKKGLAQVEIDGTAPVGTAITAAGKPVGTLFTQSGGHAIAHLRFDRAKGEMQAGDATVRWTG